MSDSTGLVTLTDLPVAQVTLTTLPFDQDDDGHPDFSAASKVLDLTTLQARPLPLVLPTYDHDAAIVLQTNVPSSSYARLANPNVWIVSKSTSARKTV